MGQGREDESPAADPRSAAPDPGDRGADRQRLASLPCYVIRLRKKAPRARGHRRRLQHLSVFFPRANEQSPCSGTTTRRCLSRLLRSSDVPAGFHELSEGSVFFWFSSFTFFLKSLNKQIEIPAE